MPMGERRTAGPPGASRRRCESDRARIDPAANGRCLPPDLPVAVPVDEVVDPADRQLPAVGRDQGATPRRSGPERAAATVSAAVMTAAEKGVRGERERDGLAALPRTRRRTSRGRRREEVMRAVLTRCAWPGAEVRRCRRRVGVPTWRSSAPPSRRDRPPPTALGHPGGPEEASRPPTFCTRIGHLSSPNVASDLRKRARDRLRDVLDESPRKGYLAHDIYRGRK